MKVLGVDIGLANTGLAFATINKDKIVVNDLQLITTEKSKNKSFYRNSDDLQRARSISIPLEEALHGIDMVFVEIPVGSQNARAMAAYGICIGVLSWVGAPLIQVRPVDIKEKTVGSKTASKQEMIDWAVATHPKAPYLRQSNGKILKANEHLADAIGAIHTGVQTDEYKSVVAMAEKVKTLVL